MTIKVYISGICGSHEVRKQQQRVLFILQSMPIDLQIIDITEPGREDDLIFMQEEAKKHDKKTQLPPQIFNDNEYCGDYADFELANDDDEIMRFLKLEEGSPKSASQNGISETADQEKSNVLEEISINNLEENNVTKLDLNDEINVTEEKDNIIDTSVAENTAFDEGISNENEEPEKKTNEMSEEESEEESE